MELHLENYFLINFNNNDINLTRNCVYLLKKKPHHQTYVFEPIHKILVLLDLFLMLIKSVH